MDRQQIAELDRLSPFEVQWNLAVSARASPSGRFLDTGRGQPNWLATSPRHAFHLLGRFAAAEAERHASHADAGWRPDPPGIADRLEAFLDAHAEDRGVDLLRATVEAGVTRHGFDADAWVGELADAVLGDSYPWPQRMLGHIEPVVHDYLIATHCPAGTPAGRFRLFATEGGAAAMSYLFQTLRWNGLLTPGDTIAVGTPIFSPYLQIPILAEYGFDIVYVQADPTLGWRYPVAELDRLRDPRIKAFFLVNPGNPGSRALGTEEIAALGDIVATDRPDLLILTDTAYATFIDGFRSLLGELPRQTIGIHSLSKHFGATGERLALIALHEDHLVDQLLRDQSAGDRARRADRYRSVTEDLDGFTFADRLAADSRDVALYHIAGLAPPQQVQLALFAVFALLDHGRSYLAMTRDVLRRRLGLLLDPLGIALPSGADTHYYTLIDVIDLARRRHGDDFATWLMVSEHPLRFPLTLAERHGVVTLPGRGFEATSWSMRVSLANLPDEAYPEVARALSDTLDDLHTAYLSSTSPQPST